MSVTKLPDGTTVFACTEDDMSIGGFIAPRDHRADHIPAAEENVQLHAIFAAFQALKALGWREAMYAPQDRTPFLAIEAGSTGIHECSRDGEGQFWIYDGDEWPARPILWKPLERKP